MKIIILIYSLLLLSSCNQKTDLTPELLIEKSQNQFSIVAQGELKALKSTPINSSSNARLTQTIAWIVPQYALVKKGDVIVKFDGVPFRMNEEAAQYEILKLEYSRAQMGRELDISLDDFNNEEELVEYQYLMAQKFNIDNPMLYTKMEMIDASDNEEFLQAKSEFVKNMSEHFQKKSESEIGLIDSKTKIQQSTVDLNKSNLNQLEVIAPHDGIVVLEKSWNGTMPQAGQSIFSGSKLASLPDLSAMEAKLFVPEIEAIGLKKDQKVSLKLHAFPDNKFTGVISRISKVAQPKKNGSPVKYFIINVLINEKDASRLLPGQRLEATIYTSDLAENLAVPIQTIFRKDEISWVYLKNSSTGEFIKKIIKTGQCSSSQCIVESGLNENDIIALIEPKTDQGKS